MMSLTSLSCGEVQDFLKTLLRYFKMLRLYPFLKQDLLTSYFVLVSLEPEGKIPQDLKNYEPNKESQTGRLVASHQLAWAVLSQAAVYCRK